MSNLTMSETDPIRAAQRKTRAQRRVGLGARCASCGESRPGALIAGTKPMTCTACKRTKNGGSTMDKHHVAGKANSTVTIKVSVNDHRAILSDAQYDWSRETRENPDGCPLRAAAACLRGFIDTIDYLVTSLLHWIVDMLELLSDLLKEKFGPQWWAGTPLAHFSPKR